MLDSAPSIGATRWNNFRSTRRRGSRGWGFVSRPSACAGLRETTDKRRFPPTVVPLSTAQEQPPAKTCATTPVDHAGAKNASIPREGGRPTAPSVLYRTYAEQLASDWLFQFFSRPLVCNGRCCSVEQGFGFFVCTKSPLLIHERIRRVRGLVQLSLVYQRARRLKTFREKAKLANVEFGNASYAMLRSYPDVDRFVMALIREMQVFILYSCVSWFIFRKGLRI